MMSAAGLGGLSQLANTQSQSSQNSTGAARQAANPYANMESGEFVKLLVQQLQNQNPSDPQDSSKILEQLSSIRNIESNLQLQDQLENLVSENQVAKASSLIGQVVEGRDGSNNEVAGQVTAVRVTDEGAQLELDTGKTLAMDRVTMITGQDGQ
jgi:flagellar basal-body rod modification protein FlgD